MQSTDGGVTSVPVADLSDGSMSDLGADRRHPRRHLRSVRRPDADGGASVHGAPVGGELADRRRVRRPVPVGLSLIVDGTVDGTLRGRDATRLPSSCSSAAGSGRERRASERELIVDAIAAALFVAVAGALLLAAGGAHLHAGAAGCSPARRLLIARLRAGRRASSSRWAPATWCPRSSSSSRCCWCLPPARRARRGRDRAGPRERRGLDVRPGPAAPGPVGGARRVARRRTRAWSCCWPGRPRSASTSCRCWRWRSPRAACWI